MNQIFKKSLKNNLFRTSIFLSILFFIFSLNFIFQKTEVKAALGVTGIVTKLVPKNPRPNQEVTLYLNSYSFDINSAETSIFLNNKLYKKEIGLKEVKFKVGDYGEKTVVLISSVDIRGQIIKKILEISPATVDLVYQLDNPYKPFGYKGKAVAISNSSLTIFALPTLVDSKGRKLDENSLIYTWYKNYNIDTKNSGLGKKTYHINRLDAYPRETEIKVEVTSLDKTKKATGYLSFKPKSTEIDFYLLEPSLPFKFKNIANPNITSKYLDTRIMAAPYFIDLDDRDVRYTWKINNKKARGLGGDKWNEILLSNSKDKFTSRVNLSFEVYKKYRILQSANRDIAINFIKENKKSDNVFFSKGSVEEKADGNFFGL